MQYIISYFTQVILICYKAEDYKICKTQHKETYLSFKYERVSKPWTNQNCRQFTRNVHRIGIIGRVCPLSEILLQEERRLSMTNYTYKRREETKWKEIYIITFMSLAYFFWGPKSCDVQFRAFQNSLICKLHWIILLL